MAKRRIIASTVGEGSITKAITGIHSYVSSCLCPCVTGINIGSDLLFYAARTCSAILESSRSVVSFVRRRSYAKRTCVRTCAYTQVSAQHTVEYRSPNRLDCIFLCCYRRATLPVQGVWHSLLGSVESSRTRTSQASRVLLQTQPNHNTAVRNTCIIRMFT